MSKEELKEILAEQVWFTMIEPDNTHSTVLYVDKALDAMVAAYNKAIDDAQSSADELANWYEGHTINLEDLKIRD